MPKNLKKATGTMKKKDVYYKVVDIKTKKIEWPKIVAHSGTLEPKLKKEVEEFQEDKALGEPYLKLGRVKKTLVLRVKDGKKHIGEWVLVDAYTPPPDVTGKDAEYVKRLQRYAESRKDLLDRMNKLKAGVDKMRSAAYDNAENIEKVAGGVPALQAKGETEKVQKVLQIGKKQLEEIEMIGKEAQRQLDTAEKLQDEQRSWKASTLELDVSDYNDHSDTWWEIVKVGQDITSAVNDVKGLVPALARLLNDTELALLGTAKDPTQVEAELKEIAEGVTKIRKDVDLYLSRIEGHRNRFLEIKTQMTALTSSDERQEVYDADVPKRLVNSQGYAGRSKPALNELSRTLKRLQRLKPVVSTVTDGEKQQTAILAEAGAANQAIKNMLVVNKEVEDLAPELEELIGDD